MHYSAICPLVVTILQMVWATEAPAAAKTLDPKLYHLRINGPREWSEFPAKPDRASLELTFDSKKNDGEQTLCLRQQDVKQRWQIVLNGKQLGTLIVDENDMVVCFPVPKGLLVDGQNRLQISQDVRRRSVPDDIRVGQIVLNSRPVKDVLGESTVHVEVQDGRTKQPLPSRITILRSDGAMQSVGAESNDHLAVRPGIVYTANGRAQFGLPPGNYTLYAGRGFEYSLAKTKITAAAGQNQRVQLTIRRQVPTAGFVACDTHVHSRTHSGHGDSTVQERMITLAGEGIELPIATDHNVHIDHAPFARQMKVRQYFTPVIGNEVTTPVGHFNIFPVAAGAPIPKYKLNDWTEIFGEIYRVPGVRAVILNHGRDLHGGTRPLGPKLHHAAVGENLSGWPPGMNAMETVNSGATQTDILQLFHDWMGLLNRGRQITPVGSSDSHDVGRHFVGQGRTYIRCDDRDPGNLDVDQAVSNFVQGRVMVSYGLLAELSVNGKYRSGEMARVAGKELLLSARALGPDWVRCTEVRLYANGRLIRKEKVSRSAAANAEAHSGVHWSGNWTLPVPKHDMHFVAIALGPGVDGLYWKTAKPYQPTSPDWRSQVLGCSGAVWVDADGDGRPTSARDYARQAVADSAGALPALMEKLARFDSAVASQAAHLLRKSRTPVDQDSLKRALSTAAPQTRKGFDAYSKGWKAHQAAAASGKK